MGSNLPEADLRAHDAKSLVKFPTGASAVTFDRRARYTPETGMRLSIGTRLGPYEIISPLGAGGMGEVYRARDTKLDREVAIKVLPATTANDPDRLARFEREAKVLASLNHPQIAQIYGLEQSGETRALVMELVAGSTLTVPQPMHTAIQFARQIAEAIEAAHEKGITHRDLKPGNIMVTPEGTVKVLDFGLASAPGGESASNPANSPTITMAAATQAGIILGTAAYMSPEQAAGKPVDKRSDIWSFGVVLYEMLSGARLFEGETLSHTLAHVLTRPIDLGNLPKDTPPAIVTLLRRCLDRDPKKRLRDIGEARVAIEEYLANPKTAAATVPAGPMGRARVLAPWLVAGVALALAAGLGWRQFLRPAETAFPVRFTVSPPPKSAFAGADTMALSPDGRYLAFTAGYGSSLAEHQLWVRPIDSTEPHLVSTYSGAYFPFWSPDSRFIGCWTPEGLKKVSVEGGVPVSVTKAHPMGGTWNRNGVILIGDSGGSISQVPEGGGEPTPVLRLDKSRQESSQTWPQFLPDGRRFLYFSRSAKQSAIYLGTLGSSETRQVVESDGAGAYAEGYLLFVRGQSLVAQPFQATSGKLTGALFPVVEKIGIIPEIPLTTFSISASGALAFRSGVDTKSVIGVFNRKGERIGSAGPPGDYAQITLSPDEKRLAVDRREKGSYDIWMLDLASGVFSRVTFDPANDRDPVFSPDGREIVFTNNRSGMPHLYRKTIGGKSEELIYSGPDREASEAWLRDGSILFGNLGGRKYFLLRPGEAQPRLIYQSDYQVDEPAISPDGKWVAYGSIESGRWEAYVARFPEWDERRQISTEGGVQPHWRQDGREIVYATSEGKLISVTVKPGPSFEATSPVLLFNSDLRASGTVEQWTMSRDGSKFYVLTSVQEGDKPMTVVVNWLAQARK
jgi:Tol biopolymer transport system component